jgi:predicted GNAT superfamily acetyltransferase
MGEAVVVRPLSSLEDCRTASALIDRIWGERRIIGAPLLRAMAEHGGQVLGAFDGQRMVGTQIGVIGLTEAGPALHSHITGIAPETQHRGIGFLLKRAQRDWCLERGIDTVTWTFDPMVARNARFNLHKLGAVAERFHRDYYGEMEDTFNRGDRSDRLEIRWDLRGDRVVQAVAGRPPEPDLSDAVLVRIPADYHALRAEDPAAAAAWRDAVADALESRFAQGYRATGFVPDGSYVMERG